MSKFNEVFRSTTLFEGDNDSLKYETYRMCFKIWQMGQEEVLNKLEEYTYYDCNTGQQCFLDHKDIDDIRMEL